jgi:hypothetical protein
MRLATLSLLLVSACAYGQVDEPQGPPAPDASAPVVRDEPPTAPPLRCEVASKEYFHTCVLFHLICEDGSTTLAVKCPEPMGTVTNPPRPVSP